MQWQCGSNDGIGWHHGNVTATTVMVSSTAMAMAAAIEGAMTMRCLRRRWTSRGRQQSKVQRQHDGVEGTKVT
jgi:hypothetical protein